MNIAKFLVVLAGFVRIRLLSLRRAPGNTCASENPHGYQSPDLFSTFCIGKQSMDQSAATVIRRDFMSESLVFMFKCWGFNTE